ncbi:DUF4376 domain-containing protein [Pseudomonas sp. 24 R 17]|uniref:DUF4376 domain-containing protein n=1 Tax=Pseudomonas sp. 24 R 17 TaxID=1844096 RepID=UPI00081BDE68|nr:DUF4376 domain-containing protein [Pseudomonas sp. 24 R 17]
MSVIYAVFNNDGLFQQMLISGVHAIPDGAVKLSDDLSTRILQQPDSIWRIDDSGAITSTEPESLPPTREQIDAERDRRIDAGVTFDGVLYQSKTTDRENIAGAAQMAFMAVVAGVQPGDLRWSNPDQDFAWICAENTLVPMDAQTVVEFGRTAALRKSELIYAGRALKDLPEIPENFTDDVWWPA